MKKHKNDVQLSVTYSEYWRQTDYKDKIGPSLSASAASDHADQGTTRQDKQRERERESGKGRKKRSFFSNKFGLSFFYNFEVGDSPAVVVRRRRPPPLSVHLEQQQQQQHLRTKLAGAGAAAAGGSVASVSSVAREQTIRCPPCLLLDLNANWAKEKIWEG